MPSHQSQLDGIATRQIMRLGGNLVEDSRTDDIIQHGHHMLALWTTHGHLG